MFYCHIYRLGSFMEGFSCRVRTHKSILISYFTRYLQRLVKFWQRRKKWKVDSVSKLREKSGFTVSWKYYLNLCSLRRLKEACCAEVYTNLLRLSVFGKYLRWVFQVCFRRFPVGRLLRSKMDYQGQILVNKSATAGRFYEWVSVFLEKC